MGVNSSRDNEEKEFRGRASRLVSLFIGVRCATWSMYILNSRIDKHKGKHKAKAKANPGD